MKAMMMNRSLGQGVAASLVVVGLLCLPGCRNRSERSEDKTITGTVTSIDEATGKVAMKFRHKEKKIDMEYEGTVDQNSEILINGRVAKLSEVNTGDRVIVTGYRDKQRKRMMVVKVEIEREGWERSPTATTKAATKPAAKAPAPVQPPTKKAE
ncbi:MAG: hypothetical protein JXQ73_23495 [Phycisphaerae bacterium]|nr:hypothetical protein [Phycisphaerae bacterium]